MVVLIPVLSEPTHDINLLLEPLVRELTKLWAGVEMEVHNGTALVKEIVRCFAAHVIYLQEGRFVDFWDTQPH